MFIRKGAWEAICLLILVSLLCWMYIPSLGMYPYRDWDESIYAQVAKQATNPFALTWLGQGASYPQNLWFEKPPLVEWLVRFSYTAFGVGEFAGRLVTFVFGFATVGLVYVWARRLWGVLGGFLALGSLFACFHLLLNLGTLNYDVPVGFWMALSLWAYSLVRDRPKFWLLFWLGLAIGALTKSVVGVLPLVVVAVDSLFVTGWSRPWRASAYFWRGGSMFLLVVLPWHVIESVHFGGSFWHVYLWYHVVARFSQGIESNGGPWWYYFTIFTQMPYGILALVGLAYGACASWRKNYQVQLLFVSAAVVFVTFSLARTKGSGYVVIIYPYLSLLFAAVSVWALSFLPKFWQRLAVTVVLVVTFVLVGFSYNQYRLVKMNGAVYTDIRTIGQWISVHEPTARLHYVSLKTPMDIIAARPALVYYTNRFVDERGREEVDSLPKPRLRLATHLLYVRNGEVYVVAVRLVP